MKTPIFNTDSFVKRQRMIQAGLVAGLDYKQQLDEVNKKRELLVKEQTSHLVCLLGEMQHMCETIDLLIDAKGLCKQKLKATLTAAMKEMDATVMRTCGEFKFGQETEMIHEQKSSVSSYFEGSYQEIREFYKKRLEEEHGN